jgi:hypothetical protein
MVPVDCTLVTVGGLSPTSDSNVGKIMISQILKLCDIEIIRTVTDAQNKLKYDRRHDCNSHLRSSITVSSLPERILPMISCTFLASAGPVE